ncbi:cysteine synthase family protein [Ktedonosporobacter rubrisoli]|uniref:Cysteine synthase family protein n=1 Tax=Ktedonosporobacter rubrisoli TaxID=2509675 RepID=A0A4P6JR44_KTERU|nr:cysteine synthase family protein [Ktedonosporobacter rubrisoli]QBD77256.1 cysteine synthase family protein [Ktedonosporobacter rubrisoli]
MLYKNIIESIGKTPLVQLQLDGGAQGNVYGKLELLNPFGMKDRVAKQIILDARRKGVLKDGAPIIESSSGTMALGIALVGTALGHSVHIVTDPRIDTLTLTKLRALGCTIHVVDKMTDKGWQGARLERLHELMNLHSGAFWPRQYENPGNPYAYTDLANELIEDLGQVDILVASVGSGGSLSGTARALRQRQQSLHVVAVDAVGSVIFGQPDSPKRLQSGLGNSLVPKNVAHALVNEVHWLNDAEAFAATLDLAHTEKIFAGNSSGSVYAVARWLSHTVKAGTNIVAIFPDRGDRYLNTIYNESYRIDKGVNQGHLPAQPEQVTPDTAVQSWSFTQLKRLPLGAGARA